MSQCIHQSNQPQDAYQNRSLRQSLQTSAEESRKCLYCEKIFSTLTSYKEHMKVKHENVTPTNVTNVIEAMAQNQD